MIYAGISWMNLSLRVCPSHSCPATLGQHDNGHTWCTCSCNWASKQWADEATTCRKERQLYKQCHVEEHPGAVFVSVSGDMVSSGERESSFWSQWSWLRPYLEHPHLQFICLLPGEFLLKTHCCCSHTIISHWLWLEILSTVDRWKNVIVSMISFFLPYIGLIQFTETRSKCVVSH